MALLIPPAILSLHIQFSLIYQIWLHNDVIGNLGPLEYLINTPRQHRVHHGKNPYCIDKNYGALLMIWDRLFGTYQEEKERIIFGTVDSNPKTFDLLTLQFSHYGRIMEKFNNMNGTDKLSALLKGPGWMPNKPRLGLIADVPEPIISDSIYSYQPNITNLKKVYIFFHGVIIVIGFYVLAQNQLFVSN